MSPIPSEVEPRGTPQLEPPHPLEARWQRLRLFEAQLQERLERALGPHGLSCSEYVALAALHDSDDGGHLRQQVLADAIPINQSSLSRMVERLERNGWTTRYHCENDRRGVYTQITEQGRAKVDEARRSYLDTLDAAVAEKAAEGDGFVSEVAALLRR